MFNAWLQRTKLQIVDTGLNQGGESFLEQIEKGELVAAARFIGEVNQRNRYRRRRRREVGDDFFVANRFENVLHRFLKLFEGHDVLVISEMQIKRDAFRDVFGQPPTRIARLVRRAIDRCVQPVPVELEELS